MNRFTSLALFVLASDLGLAQRESLFPSGATRVDVEGDALLSGDIDIINSRVAFEQTRGAWRVRGRVSAVHHRVEYTPTFITSASIRREDAQSFDLLVERTLSPNFTLVGTLAYGQ